MKYDVIAIRRGTTGMDRFSVELKLRLMTPPRAGVSPIRR